jgi:hypothetical protein
MAVLFTRSFPLSMQSMGDLPLLHRNLTQIIGRRARSCGQNSMSISALGPGVGAMMNQGATGLMQVLITAFPKTLPALMRLSITQITLAKKIRNFPLNLLRALMSVLASASTVKGYLSR